MSVNIRIVRRVEWGAPQATPAAKISTPTREVWLHHTAGSEVGADGMRKLRSYAMNNHNENYVDINYSFVISPEGTIYEARGAGRDSAATSHHNQISHAICVMGNYEYSTPSANVIHSIATLLAYGAQERWWSAPRLTGGHRDASGNATACPGRNLYAKIPEINSLAQRIFNGQVGGNMPNPPKDTPKKHPTIQIGSRGASVSECQKKLNAVLGCNMLTDGIFGPRTANEVKRFQRFCKLAADGIVGPVTWRHLDYFASLKGVR